jgi:hypothetical protein
MGGKNVTANADMVASIQVCPKKIVDFFENNCLIPKPQVADRTTSGYHDSVGRLGTRKNISSRDRSEKVRVVTSVILSLLNAGSYSFTNP